MIRDNYNKRLQEWLAESPYAADLYFNFAPAEAGVTNVATIAGERVLKHYLSGYALMCYEFGIVQYKPVNSDVPNNDDNAEMMHDVELFMDWIREQNALHNLPRFEGCEMQRAEVLSNLPFVAGVDNEVAKYMFSCRVTYVKKEF